MAVPSVVLLATVVLPVILAGCSGEEQQEQAPLFVLPSATAEEQQEQTPPFAPLSAAGEGQAPPFALPSADGRQVSLASLLAEHDAVVLVFYRGFF